MDHTSCRLRLAAIADAPAILEIYAQYMDTPITFETELPSLEEFEGRDPAITTEYTWTCLARMKRQNHWLCIWA